MQGDYEAVARYLMPDHQRVRSAGGQLAHDGGGAQRKPAQDQRDGERDPGRQQGSGEVSDQLLRANDNLEITVRARTLELQQLAEGLAVSNSTKTRFIANTTTS